MTPSLVSARAAVPLVRVGLHPKAGQFPDRKYLALPAHFRFDEPLRRCSVLYAAQRRRGALLEILAQFRPALGYLAERKRRGLPPEAANSVHISWFEARETAHLRVRSKLPFFDLRTPESRETVREELAPFLRKHRLKDFDTSSALSSQRKLSQAIAGWAYDNGWGGIIFSSRLDPQETCWAIFERAGTRVETVKSVPLDLSNNELRSVLALFRVGVTL